MKKKSTSTMKNKEGETIVPTIKDDALNQPPNQIRLKRTWIFDMKTDATEITGVSMTVPDDTFSLTEMLQRFALGENLDKHNRPGFFPTGEEEPEIDDIDLEKFNHLDVIEQQEIFEKLAQEIRDIREEQKAKKEAEKLAEKPPEKQG